MVRLTPLPCEDTGAAHPHLVEGPAALQASMRAERSGGKRPPSHGHRAEVQNPKMTHTADTGGDDCTAVNIYAPPDIDDCAGGTWRPAGDRV